MLTDMKCRNAVCSPDAKRERLADSGGLYLEISPAGSKRWFWKYRYNGKEGRMALGSYPAVSLTAARKARDVARLQKSTGVDPVQVRRVEKLKAMNPEGDTFKVVALEWFSKQKAQWSDTHAVRVLRQLERDLFPWLGDRRQADIEPVELLATLRKIEARGAMETADRGLMVARQVWRYGVATGRVERDITGDLKGRCHPTAASTSRPSPILKSWESCCGPSKPTGEGSLCVPHCSSLRFCSSVQASFGVRRGLRSIWMGLSGPYLPPA